MTLAQKIARVLLDTKAVKISTDPPFEWTSGIKSPIYCDNRILPSHIEARDAIINGFLEKIKAENLTFDAVAGVSTGAIAFGALLADRLKKPYAYIRPKERNHGAGKQVEGDLPKGCRVLIIEDLFSTAESSLAALKAMRKEVTEDIVGIMAISTYQFSMAEKNLAEANVNWWTLTNFSEIIKLLEITDDEKSVILKFAENPKEWNPHY